uniref:Uncharacterized protein n=1 Tax=Arundo donax TaxID=35708 RepID=A0A0A8XS76_ARUDO
MLRVRSSRRRSGIQQAKSGTGRSRVPTTVEPLARSWSTT